MLVGGVGGGEGKPPGNSLEHGKLEHERDVEGGQGKPPRKSLARKKVWRKMNQIQLSLKYDQVLGGGQCGT